MAVHGGAYGVTPALAPDALPCCSRPLAKSPFTRCSGAPAVAVVLPPGCSPILAVTGAVPVFFNVSAAVADFCQPTVLLIAPGVTVSRGADSARSAAVAQLAATFTVTSREP